MLWSESSISFDNGEFFCQHHGRHAVRVAIYRGVARVSIYCETAATVRYLAMRLELPVPRMVDRIYESCGEHLGTRFSVIADKPADEPSDDELVDLSKDPPLRDDYVPDAAETQDNYCVARGEFCPSK
jgi:hypothetical protein